MSIDIHGIKISQTNPWVKIVHYCFHTNPFQAKVRTTDTTVLKFEKFGDVKIILWLKSHKNHVVENE